LDGSSPETPIEELKKLYFDKLREFHPDKRPGSPGVTGPAATQALNDAWQVLRDPERRKAYDAAWAREQDAALPAKVRAETFRKRGNELFSQARDLGRKAAANIAAAQESLKKYNGAMDQYSKGLDVMPEDHKLWSNRSLCYLAVEDWRRAREDADRCVKLRPDFMKGWFLLAKSLWKMGQPLEAQRELDRGLHHLQNNRDLLELRAEISAEDPDGYTPGNACASRSVSPAACTPPISRATTPTPGSASFFSNRSTTAATVPPPDRDGASTPPQSHRPSSSKSPGAGGRKSASLAGAVVASRQAAATAASAATRVESNSVSPGPGASQSPGPASHSPGPSRGGRGAHTPPRPGGRPSYLGASGTHSQTQRSCTFGAPTPNFRHAPELNSSQRFGNTYASQGLGSTCGPAGHSFGGPGEQERPRPPSQQSQPSLSAQAAQNQCHQSYRPPSAPQPTQNVNKSSAKEGTFIQRMLRKTVSDPLNASRASNAGFYCPPGEQSFGGSFGGPTAGANCSRGVNPPPPWPPQVLTRAAA